MQHIESIARLVNEFSKLPGVGRKSAERYAYFVINGTMEDAKTFSDAIISAKENVRFCKTCGNFAEEDECGICRTRKHDKICVVTDVKDILAIEKAKSYDGVYHVLGGTISPLQGRSPDDLRIKELLERVGKGEVKEIIMATNPDVEGEATAMYVAKLLKPLDVKVTKIAQGVSMGSNLEYADEVTLSRALEDRKEM